MSLTNEEEEKLAGLDTYLRECVRINPEDIQGEFERIPGQLAYWNAQYANALRDALRAKIDLDTLRANLDPVCREALLNAHAKITEPIVEAAIESHDELVAAKFRHAEAEVAKNEAFGRLDAIRAKKEMLVSLGAQLRAEMGGDPLIRDRVASARKYGNGEG